jgi:hypothetical protein
VVNTGCSIATRLYIVPYMMARYRELGGKKFNKVNACLTGISLHGKMGTKNEQTIGRKW